MRILSHLTHIQPYHSSFRLQSVGGANYFAPHAPGSESRQNQMQLPSYLFALRERVRCEKIRTSSILRPPARACFFIIAKLIKATRVSKVPKLPLKSLRSLSPLRSLRSLKSLMSLRSLTYLIPLIPRVFFCAGWFVDAYRREKVLKTHVFKAF